MITEIMVGRQPIFNRKKEVIGYELLFRSPQSQGAAQFIDGDKATTDVIINAFSTIGLQNLVGDKIAFINLTENFILGKYPIPFPPQQVALEVLENIPITKPVIDGLKKFSQLGYRIALDDVDDLNKVRGLLPLATIIKIDLPKVNHNSLIMMVHSLKQLEKKILVEKVETQEEFDYCYQQGCHFFQGYFLCKPNIVKSKRLDASRLVVINTLSKIQDPKVSFKDLENMITQDVTLSIKLLRLINSAYYATTTQIKTISQAISMIGTDYLRGWLTLMLISTILDKPHELTTIALTRARFCELLAKARHLSNTASYFTCGLLSVMDALLDIAMEQIVQQILLSDDIARALLKHEGDIGKTLSYAISHEQGQFNGEQVLNLPAHKITDAYLKSIQWASSFAESFTA